MSTMASRKVRLGAITVAVAVAIALLLLVGVQVVSSAGFTAVDVIVFGEPGNIVDDASAEFHTNPQRIKIKYEANHEPGHIITLWWVVFNNPDACSDGVCGVDDLPPNNGGDNSAEAANMFGGGMVAEDDGHVFIQHNLRLNRPRGQVLPWSVPGVLTDMDNAEVHVLVRTHGPEQPGLLEEMLTTFGGGCNNGWPPALGTPGDFHCADLHVMVAP